MTICKLISSIKLKPYLNIKVIFPNTKRIKHLRKIGIARSALMIIGKVIRHAYFNFNNSIRNEALQLGNSI